MPDGAWIGAIVLGLVAAGLATLWRRAEGRGEALAVRLAALEAERDRLDAALSRESAARGRLAEELAGHRRKADKARRREGRAPEAPLGTATRVRDLEERIARAEAAGDRLRIERDALQGRVTSLGTALEEAIARAEAAAVVAAAAAETRAPEPEGPVEAATPADAVSVELAESRRRITELESALEQSRTAEARLRKRTSNQEQLYASLRSELEVKKDRLRTQEELIQRLQALEAAVVAAD